MKATDLFKKFAEKFPEAKRTEFREETTFTLSLSQIKEACQFCRDTLEFDLLIDICSVDHFGDEPRFEVVYELYSLPHEVYLRLKTSVSEDDLTVPTVSDIWPAANWEEREVYDMMGIKFKDHPDLRRILMWEGYPYYPLRKDFPLAGKDSNVPNVAFTHAAPLAGGPFVTVPSSDTVKNREPRSHEKRPAPPLPPKEDIASQP